MSVTDKLSEYSRHPLLGSIGIGCLHFAFRSRSSETISYKAYLDDVKATLESIPAVGEVSINAHPRMEQRQLHGLTNISSIKDARGCFPPWLYTSRLEFSLFIPRRVQDDLVTRLSPGVPKTQTEQFKVRLLGSLFEFPVAFVQPYSPSGIPTPSDAIVVVSEFLQNQLNEGDSKKLILECLGPSPLHADIYLFDVSAVGDQGSDSLFTVSYVPKEGYDNVLIGINVKQLQDRTDRIDMFVREAADELALYYIIFQDQQVRMHEWHTISKPLATLAGLLRARGFRSVIEWFYRTSGLINEITTSLFEFQARRIRREDYIREHYASVYGPQRAYPFFKEIVGKEMKQESSYPIKEIAELAQFAESRRTVSLQLLVNIIVGILAGIAGAAATLLAK